MLMSRRYVLVSLVFLVSSIAVGSEFQPGEVIIKFKENKPRTRKSMNAFYQTLGVEDVHRFNGIMKGYEHLILEENIDVEEAVKRLNQDPTVAYAQPNYIVHALPVVPETKAKPHVQPHDLRIPCLLQGVEFPPGCNNTSPLVPNLDTVNRPDLKEPPEEVNPPIADPDLHKVYGLEKIGAIEAWKIHQGSKNFIVANIDSGIDYNHEDLAFNLWRNPNPGPDNDIVGYDFVHEDGLPYDDNSHGTHTVGTIGAVGDNGIGMSGVIPKVSLMSLKFLAADGSGTTADAIRAIDYAVSHGAKVLNNSWGGQADSGNRALQEAIEQAGEAGVLFIAAAGNEDNDNDGFDPNYPAAFDSDNLISVAATDSEDHLADFSNYGRYTTHLAAPGVEIYSTVPGNQYRYMKGTSMACPHVAGAAALVWSAHPSWTYKEVKTALLNSVDLVDELSDKTITGGRLNVLRAIQMTRSDLKKKRWW